MPSTPTTGANGILYAFVPSLNCTLEVSSGMARLNGGAWQAMPCFLVEGENMLGISAFSDGIYNLSFTDTSSIFSDVTPQANDLQSVDTVVIEFVNLDAIAKNVGVFASKPSTTATFSVSPSAAVVTGGLSQFFTFTRTPKPNNYWGSLKDGGQFGFEVIDA